MRVAVLADVHGNRLALAAVCAEITAAAPDLVVELGDAVSGPLWPAETFEMLGELDAVALRGNHDRWVAAAASAEPLGASDAFAWLRLAPAQRAALGTRPPCWRDAGLLAMHALPEDDTSYLLHEVTAHGVRERAAADVSALLPPAAGETLVLTAHTHRARLACLADGRLVLNPGSVGQPAYRDDAPFPHVMQAGAPHARWAMAELQRGAWRVTFHATPYDWDHAASEAARNGRDDWAAALAHGILN
jgi:predicted phosphodiesterase